MKGQSLRIQDQTLETQGEAVVSHGTSEAGIGPLEIENVCCRKQPCVTTQEFFQLAMLDMNVISTTIVNQSDVFADDLDYSPSSYQKATYHQ